MGSEAGADARRAHRLNKGFLEQLLSLMQESTNVQCPQHEQPQRQGRPAPWMTIVGPPSMRPLTIPPSSQAQDWRVQRPVVQDLDSRQLPAGALTKFALPTSSEWVFSDF